MHFGGDVGGGTVLHPTEAADGSLTSETDLAGALSPRVTFRATPLMASAVLITAPIESEPKRKQIVRLNKMVTFGQNGLWFCGFGYTSCDQEVAGSNPTGGRVILQLLQGPCDPAFSDVHDFG